MQIEISCEDDFAREIAIKIPFCDSAWQLRRKIRLQAGETKQIDASGMSILEFKANWNIAKGKLKQRFARLTDDEQQFTEGKENELVGRIQKRTSRAHKLVAETAASK